MTRLLDWFRTRFRPPSPSPIEARSEHAYQQIRQVNQLVKGMRESRERRASGNPVADMVTGQYRPQTDRKARR